MKASIVLALTITALCSAAPVVPSEDLQNKGITDIISSFLPGLLSGLGQIAGAGLKTLSGLGLSTSPQQNSNQVRSDSDYEASQEELVEVGHVIAALTEGAMEFAKYAHLGQVATQLAQIHEELGSAAHI